MAAQQNGNDSNLFQWINIKARIHELIIFLPTFLKNPVEGIKRAPSWDWQTILILEILVSGITSVAGGIVARHFFAIISGVIVGPIMGLVVTTVLTGILYYACLFLMKTELDFKRLFIIVVLAQIPSQILGILSPLARPIGLLCLIFTALLLIVGMVENFLLDKKKISQIVGALALAASLIWLYNMVMDANVDKIKARDFTPESLQQLEKELKNR